MSDAHADIARSYGHPDSARFRKILEKLLNANEARIAVSLPSSIQKLAGKLGIDEKQLEPLLAGLVSKGVAFKASIGYKGANDIIHLHDATSRNTKSDILWGRDLLDLWADFDENELFNQITEMVAAMMSPIFRVIPARGSVAEGELTLPNERLEDLVAKVSKIVVVPCACRRILGKCGHPLEMCLQLNEDAEYALQQGTGRELNAAEALEVLDQASRAGLVTNVQNLDEVSTVICNCCNDCCMFLYPFIRDGNTEKGLSPSRFGARVDTGLCTGCQDCVERCPFGAIGMVKVVGSKKLKAYVSGETCYGCGICAVACSHGAIKLYETRPLEHIPS